MRWIIFFGVMLYWSVTTLANEPFVVIDSITVKGNKKSRSTIILRELPFQIGDTVTLSQLPNKVEWGKQQILNTSLFKTASITYKNWQGDNNHIHLLVEVEEMWYIYPIPLFYLADRNFNVWWVDHKASLSRINYGIDFVHQNLTGNGDHVQLTVSQGYTQIYKFGYRKPYINHQQTLGLTSNFQYLLNKEVNYITEKNKQEFYRNGEGQGFAYKRLSASIGLVYRAHLRHIHAFHLEYYRNQIADPIAQDLNPNFFLNGKTVQRYLSLSYSYSYDRRDVRPYPQNGKYLYFSIEKKGLGIWPKDRNALTTYWEYSQFFPFWKRFNFALTTKAKYSIIRSQQPYNDNRALGFNNYNLIGYEYYIADGLDMGIISTRLRFKLFKSQINFGKLMPIHDLRSMPFRFYLSVNSEMGYVNNPYAKSDNNFSNQLLWGRGVGLDGIFFYDKLFRFEYSVNHLGLKGIYFSYKMNL
jgi:outer membrane protein assembly factor BamA